MKPIHSRFRTACFTASPLAMALVGISPVHAQTQETPPITSGPAQDDPGAPSQQDIVVTGRSTVNRQPGGGLLSIETAPKAVQTISRDFIAKQSPTVNVQQLLAMQPSANVADADAYGLLPGQSYIRGLDSSETSWMMEGMPLNDMSSGKFFPQELVEAEDLESVSLQPGSVNITTPTVDATGGSVVMTLQNPTHRFGGLVDFSVGSDDMTREYIRVNTGDISDTGIRGYVSYSHIYADNWTGVGHANKHHVNAKFVKDFDNGSKASLIIAYNNEVANFYRQPTLAQFRASGNDFNYSSDPGTSLYYELQVNPYKNFSASLPTHWVLSDRLSIDDTPYVWDGIGGGAFGVTVAQGSTYAGTQPVNVDLGVPTGTSVVAEQIGQNNLLRLGNTLIANYKLGSNNTLSVGWWYQHTAQLFYNRIGMVDQTTGEPSDIWGKSGYYTYGSGTPYDWAHYHNHADVNMLFAQDAIDAADGRFHAEIGAKYAIIASRISSAVPGDNPVQNLTTHKFLPQAGISWKFDDANQIYANVSTSFRAPLASSLVNLYSRTSGALTQTSGPTRPEFVVSEEIGYRYNGPVIVASISGFHYHFKDRQISLSTLVNGSLLSRSMNAGTQNSWGFDAQLATRPIWFHLRPYLTFEYLDARIGSNLPATSLLNGVRISDYLPTKGKNQVSSPHEQAGVGIDYDDGHLFLNAQVKYVSKQYSTFMNDEAIPSYFSTRLGLGYRLPAFHMFKAPQIQLNMNNLFNRVARTGVYTLQTNAVATKGVLGGTVSASSPTYYLMPGRSFTLTLSTAF